MKKEQIIKLWKEGHSRRYIYEEEYHSLKASGKYPKTTKALVLKEIAKKNIEAIILEEYKSKNKS